MVEVKFSSKAHVRRNPNKIETGNQYLLLLKSLIQFLQLLIKFVLE
jgi:hypothetical protein